MTSQTYLAATPASLMPLMKFSHATMSGDSIAPIPWIHLPSHNDLFAIFDSVDLRTSSGTAERRQRFRVLQDPSALEDIDLTVLAIEAQKAAAVARAAPDPRRNPYVTIIVRAPCIAMRYPTAHGHVRRFQIRFAQQEHFYEAMSILTKAGVPTSEAGAVPNMQPPSITNLPNLGIIPPQDEPTPASISAPRAFTDRLPVNASGQGTASQEAFTVPRSYNEVLPTNVGSSCPRISSVSHASTPLSWQKSTSDTIQPLTARQPLCLSQTSTNTYDEMPPKRVLPFPPRKSKKGEVVDGTTEPVTSETAQGDNPVESHTMASLQIGTVIDEIPSDTATTKGRKRPAAKPKRVLAPKKPKTIAARKQKAGGLPVIPAIGELFVQKNDANESTRVSTVNMIDTQVLMASCEAKLSARREQDRTSASLKTITSVKRTITDDDSTVHDQSVLASEMNMAAHTKPSISQAMIISPVEQSTNDLQLIHAGQGTVTLSELSRLDVNGKRVDHEAGCEIVRTVDATNSPAVPQSNLDKGSKDLDHATTSQLAVLPDGSATANAAERLSDFVSLPPHDQNQLLESFICRALEDDNFTRLCKQVESVWARAFFFGDV